jgi:uncharacterized protein
VNPLITVANLRSQTVKDLSAMAREIGLTGVHSMRKDQLVRALLKAVKSKSKPGTASARGANRTVSKPTSSETPRSDRSKKRDTRSRAERRRSTNQTRTATATKATDARVLRRIQRINELREQHKDLSYATTSAVPTGRTAQKQPKPSCNPAPRKDRIVLLVRDPFWLQACWDITASSVARAKAALAEHWHTCEPVLRLMQVDTGATTSTTERLTREIPVHGGVKNWYIDIKDSPNSFRVELGYLAHNGRFYALARSNIVTTPQPGSSDAIDRNWSDIAENCEKIYAMSGGYEPSSAGGELQELFEEQLRRPMGSPLVTRYGDNAVQVLRREKDFEFHVDAEMIIFGRTKAGAHVTLAGEPVKLRPDGTFTVRMSMPDRRQLVPVVANSRDGAEQRTVVLAVERNTKIMEPMIREAHE